MTERLLLHGCLKSAKERLCRAQVLIDDERLSKRLGEALDLIDHVGTMTCPDWSRFDLPMVGDPEGSA